MLFVNFSSFRLSSLFSASRRLTCTYHSDQRFVPKVKLKIAKFLKDHRKFRTEMTLADKAAILFWASSSSPLLEWFFARSVESKSWSPDTWSWWRWWGDGDEMVIMSAVQPWSRISWWTLLGLISSVFHTPTNVADIWLIFFFMVPLTLGNPTPPTWLIFKEW